MEISFETIPLRTICENEDAAIGKYGEKVAQKLKSRLADLCAISYVSQIIIGLPAEIEGTIPPSFKIDLTDNYRIVFVASHTRKFKREEEVIDWSKVSRIKIMSIDVVNE